MIFKFNSIIAEFYVLAVVILLFSVPPVLVLAIRTVPVAKMFLKKRFNLKFENSVRYLPVDQDCYGHDKDDVGNEYRGDDGRHRLLSVVVSDHHPGVVCGVIAREGLPSLAVIVVFLSKYITDDIRRIDTT